MAYTYHGLTQTPEYRAWVNMKRRCINKKNRDYPKYGGRGIKVCERWLEFPNFYSDMGKKPSEGYSLDRIDNDGDYNPSNCRWASKTAQSINRGTPSNNKSGVVGVTERGNRWQAQIRINRKKIVLGTYATIEEAALVRSEAEKQYFSKYLAGVV